MKKTIEVKYNFLKNTEIVDRNSTEIKEYVDAFRREAIPEIEEIERRKAKAIEQAYRIRVCGRFSIKAMSV